MSDLTDGWVTITKYRAVQFGTPTHRPVGAGDWLRFWWGMDIWFYRVPVLKTQAAVLIIAETARWLT